MNYAPWSKRAAGYLIDWGAVFVPSAIGQLLDLMLHDHTGASTAKGQLANAVFGFVTLGVLLYNRWLQGGRTGQTWGRSFQGLRLLDGRTAQPIGVGRAFTRDLSHLLDTITLGAGWLLPLWDGQRQTLADKIMNTVVVDQP